MGPSSPPERGTPAQQSLPTFRSMCIVTKRLHQSICHLVWRYIGLGSGDTVLDGDSVLPYPQKGHSPSPIFSPCLLWPNSWMDQDATWYRGRHQATLCYMGTQLPPNRGTISPIFGPCLLWPNGWIDQDATRYGGRPRPRPHCVRWGPPSSPPPWKGEQQPPTFQPMSLCQTVADLSN